MITITSQQKPSKSKGKEKQHQQSQKHQNHKQSNKKYTQKQPSCVYEEADSILDDDLDKELSLIQLPKGTLGYSSSSQQPKKQKSRQQSQDSDTSEDELALIPSSNNNNNLAKRDSQRSFPTGQKQFTRPVQSGLYKSRSNSSSSLSNNNNLTRKASEDSSGYILPDTPKAKKFKSRANGQHQERGSTSSTSPISLQRQISSLNLSSDQLDSSPYNPDKKKDIFDSSFEISPTAVQKYLSASSSSSHKNRSSTSTSQQQKRAIYNSNKNVTKTAQSGISTSLFSSSPSSSKNKHINNALQTSNKINLDLNESFSSSSKLPNSKDSPHINRSSDIFCSTPKDVENDQSKEHATNALSATKTEIEDNDNCKSIDEDIFGGSTRKLIAMGHPLCPFCDEPLPLKPSSSLKKDIKRLRRHPQVRPRKGSYNPDALTIPAHDSISCCRRHRNETSIIPKGKERGWPGKDDIDWEALPERIRIRAVTGLKQIITGKKPSHFEMEAKREWNEKGPRQMRNVFNELETFQSEIPGYYGERGYEIIMNALESIFQLDMYLIEKRAPPLSVNAYFRRVLVPETAVLLIQEDIKCQKDQAHQILKDSREYGLALFGIDEEEGVKTSSDADDYDGENIKILDQDQEQNQVDHRGDKNNGRKKKLGTAASNKEKTDRNPKPPQNQ